MDKTKLERYAELKRIVKQAEEEMDPMKEEILTMMGDHEEVETDFGKFVVTHRRTYTYPEEIKQREDDLKKAKKTCEQLGTAEYVEKSILMFKEVV